MTCKCELHDSQKDHFLEEFEGIKYLIIKNKILYYRPELVKGKPIHDEQYDSFEFRYLQLCEILGFPNELVHKEYPDVPEHLNGTGMMEIDMEHSEVKEVFKTMRKK